MAQVRFAVDAWREAQKKYEESTLKGESLQKTKGAVFAAAFPGPDCVVAIPHDPDDSADSDSSVINLNDKAVKKLAQSNKMADDKYLLDFLGPSIDTGFRIISQSTDRYFTMSLEVAWAYAENSSIHEINNAHEIELLGEKQLKSVWRSRAYPLFAIDRMANDPVNVALKAIHDPRCSHDKITKIFLACSQSENWPSRLYLKDSMVPCVNSEPEDVIHDGDNTSTDMEGYELQDQEEGERGAPDGSPIAYPTMPKATTAVIESMLADKAVYQRSINALSEGLKLLRFYSEES